MADVDQIICTDKSHNTGRPSCTLEQDFIQGLLAVPKGSVLAVADLAPATIGATITALLNNNNRSLRGYLLKTINITKDVGEAAQTEDRGYAGKGTTFIGSVGRTYQFFKGKRCMYNSLLPFHQSQDDFDYYEIDRSNVLWGKKVLAADGVTVTGLMGYSAADITLNNPNAKQTNASSPIILSIMYENANEFREGYGYVTAFPAISGLNGLTSLTIRAVPFAGSGIYDVYAKLPCTEGDALALYGSSLASTTAVLAFNATTGNAITTSACTYVAGTGGLPGHLHVTFDATDTDYPTPPAVFNIQFASPSVLAGLGATGVEVINVISIAST